MVLSGRRRATTRCLFRPCPQAVLDRSSRVLSIPFVPSWSVKVRDRVDVGWTNPSSSRTLSGGTWMYVSFGSANCRNHNTCRCRLTNVEIYPSRFFFWTLQLGIIWRCRCVKKLQLLNHSEILISA